MLKNACRKIVEKIYYKKSTLLSTTHVNKKLLWFNKMEVFQQCFLLITIKYLNN